MGLSLWPQLNLVVNYSYLDLASCALIYIYVYKHIVYIINGSREDRKRDVVVILMKDLANEQTRLNSDNSVVCL